MSIRKKNFTIFGNSESDDDLEEIKSDGNRKSFVPVNARSRAILKPSHKNKKAQSYSRTPPKDDDESIIDLDIGGTHKISVSRSLLCKIPCSKLKSTFQGNIKLPLTKENRYFVESDGNMFSLMISYLQKDQKISSFTDEFTKG